MRLNYEKRSVFVKKLSLFSILLSLMLIAFGCGGANDENNANEENNNDAGAQGDIVDIADEFLTLFVEEKYEEAVKLFDANMSQQLPADELQNVSESIHGQLGDFIDKEYRETTQSDGYDIVIYYGTYEKADVIFKVTFNADKEIAGFFVQ